MRELHAGLDVEEREMLTLLEEEEAREAGLVSEQASAVVRRGTPG